MKSGDVSPEKAGEKIEQMTKEAEPWIEIFARFGFVAKGIVYCVIGIIAALAAFQSGSDTAGSREALTAILRQPFGIILLGLVAVGLAGHALWRFVQAIKDTENKGTDFKGIARRIIYGGVGLFYAGLTFFALKLVFNGSNGDRDEDQASREWTAALMAQPFGQWLVGAVGAGFVAAGIYQFYKAFTTKFLECMMTERMSEKAERAATRIAQIGLTARGIVFGIVGVFLLQAAIGYDPNEARGLAGVLKSLDQQPFGPFILAVVAFGLIAFGIHLFVMAWYRRIDL